MFDSLTVRVPAEVKSEMLLLWKQLRMAEGLGPENDLSGDEIVDRFDGASLVEWIVPAKDVLIPLFTGILGFISARRGEVEIKDGKKTMKFKNFRPSEIRKVMEAIASSGRDE